MNTKNRFQQTSSRSVLGKAVRFAGLFFALVVAWASSGVLAPTTGLETITSAEAQTVVVGYGDSITRGFPYTATDQYGARGRNIGPRLEAYLKSTNGGAAWHWHNWGFGRMNSAQALGNFDLAMSSSRPAWVLIMIGVNDLWDGISGPSTAANIGWLIDRSRAYGSRPVVSNLTPSWYPGMGGSRIPIEYNPPIESMIQAKNAFFYDAWGHFYPVWATHNSDGLHMNPAGIARLADGWCDAMPVCSTLVNQTGGSRESQIPPWLYHLLID